MVRIVALGLLALAAPVYAHEGRTLTVINDTSARVNQLYVSGGRSSALRGRIAGIVGPGADETDRLDNRMLERGGSATFALKGGRCHYYVRAVLEDGRTFTADDVDVCAEPRWPISRGTRR